MSIDLIPHYFEKLSIIEEETPRATTSAGPGISPGENGNPITTEEETPNFLTVPNRESFQTQTSQFERAGSPERVHVPKSQGSGLELITELPRSIGIECPGD